jgi:primosomal protein N' (replication factor Y)
VVPDIPSFAVDDGFSYLVPQGLDVAIGSRVRVRVSGRRLKGFVTALFDAPDDRKLLPIDGVSGTVPSFDEQLLHVLRWAAIHYVSPMSTILRRTIPPNVPRAAYLEQERPSPREPVFTNIVSDARSHIGHIAQLVEGAMAKRNNALVIVPSVAEANSVASALREKFGADVALATSGSQAKDVTRAWARAAISSPVILVGTREIMLWPVTRVGIAVIVEDGRRVMKSPSSPTLGVREVLVERARTEGFDIAFLSPVPTLESVVFGASIVTGPGRQWPLVEVMDRSEEPPSRTVLLERTSSAIAGAVKRGGSVFVLVPKRGYAPAFRCISCGELRRCPRCDTAATSTGDCRRCGAQLTPCAKCGRERFEPLGAGIGSVRQAIARSVGDAVGVAGDNKPVTVGSERDLVAQGEVALSVAVDIDGMVHAPTFRASEDSFRLLVRLANLVQKGKGNRLAIQTAFADQPIVHALRSGRSEKFLADIMGERRKSSFPPLGELIALEIDRTVTVGNAVHDAVGAEARVLGPAPMRDRDRWLIQAPDLAQIRIALRSLVGSFRDKGARVRVDVDPIDL